MNCVTSMITWKDLQRKTMSVLVDNKYPYSEHYKPSTHIIQGWNM